MLSPLKNLVPPVTAMEWMQVDTPTDNSCPMIYECDKREFAKHSKRNSFIRIEHSEEFDWRISILDRTKVPLLRVLVFRFAPGIHARIPVFRGNYAANFDVLSDAEIGIIVAGMMRKGGMNYEECFAYEAQRIATLTASEAIN